MTRDNGGPAFPVTEYYEEKSVGSTHGLSLRDYFAGQALNGWFSTFPGPRADVKPAKVAKQVYEIADAMIAERSKP